MLDILAWGKLLLTVRAERIRESTWLPAEDTHKQLTSSRPMLYMSSSSSTTCPAHAARDEVPDGLQGNNDRSAEHLTAYASTGTYHKLFSAVTTSRERMKNARFLVNGGSLKCYRVPHTTEVMPLTMAMKTLAMADITALIPRPMAEKTCKKRDMS